MTTWRLVSAAAGVLFAVGSTSSVGHATALGARGVGVQAFTLARVDAPCFYAPTTGRGWPMQPLSVPHPIRGGFNEPRGGGVPHFGDDVAGRDQAAVYAVTTAVISSVTNRGAYEEHFSLGRFQYWHVTLAGRLGPGSVVFRGQLMGHIRARARHVHLTEVAPGCGIVDPRRPTGILHDPANTEAPVIGELAAFRANAAAFTRFKMDAVGSGDGPGTDPATPVRLTNLHGVIDFRAPVSDMPVRQTQHWPQQPLMPAAVRSYLAPPRHDERRIGPPIPAYDGSVLISAPRYFHILAYGSKRINDCFLNTKYVCSANYVFHVSGEGFNTRNVPNGPYLWCVQAVTINDRRSTRCSPIVIEN